MSLLKITTKGRYALRTMIDIAKQQTDNYISLRDISERQDLSKKYLEQIMPALLKAGLVDTVRGPSGGYRLTRDASEISLYDILSVTELASSHIPCLEAKDNCARAGICANHIVWTELSGLIDSYLKRTSLKDMVLNDGGITTPCCSPTPEWVGEETCDCAAEEK